MNTSAIAVLLALVCTLSGCGGASYQANTDPAHSDGTGDRADFASETEALNMAERLRSSGAENEALAVIATAYRRYPRDVAVISAYGRLAAINGQNELAARLLREALDAAPDDWRALSARGVLAARAGRQEDAQRALAQARAASGSDAVALNNLAVNYILSGNAPEAERLLRLALASPGLKPTHRPRIRRNLAIALAIQGNTTAAANIAGAPLPANIRNADTTTLRRIMGLGPAAAEASDATLSRARPWRPVEVRVGS